MLYLITNRKIVKKQYIDVIKDAINNGVDAIILREKDLTYEELYIIASKIKSLIKDKNILLIVNNDINVAKTIKTDGYHIGYEKFINEKPKFKGLIGVSVHNLEEAILAEKEGADYLLISHIFKTDCKKDLTPKGIKFIEEVKENVEVPVIALGGINLDNVNEVINAGADGVAVMSLIMASDTPDVITRKMKSKLI